MATCELCQKRSSDYEILKSPSFERDKRIVNICVCCLNALKDAGLTVKVKDERKLKC